MATISPFRGVFYKASRLLPSLLAPPYDVIDPAEHRKLARLNRHNMIHLTLGSSTRRRSYREIAHRLGRWLREDVLRQDSRNSLYAYCQEYSHNGHRLKFWGMLGLLKLEPIGTGHIFPHEAVMPSPVEDRLSIMEHCRANLEPIMTLYRAPSDPMDLLYAGLESVPPLLSAAFSNHTLHRIWRLPLVRTHARIRRALKRRRLFVADGHHRYHAAWMFRQRHPRLPGAQWMLSLLANTEQIGLRIEPIHRIIACSGPLSGSLALGLARFGRIERLGPRLKAEVTEPGRHVLGFYSRNSGSFRLHLAPSPAAANPRDLLEVVRLHAILPQVISIRSMDFVKDPAEAIRRTRKSPKLLACFLPSIPSQQICSIAFGGETLPQKSTFFKPKPLSGLILRLI